MQLLLLLFCCHAAVILPAAHAVPARNNKAILVGIVKEYSITSASLVGMQPEQVLYKLTIYVESSEKVSKFPNFAKNMEGKTVNIYSKEKLLPELFGKRIRIVVEYLGDEKGGVFWIKGIVEKL